MKKLLSVTLMAIIAIVVFANCSKNPTDSNSVGISVIKSKVFGDRTASNPTNPNGNSWPGDNSASISVIVGSIVISSDVIRRISQIILQDDAGMPMGRNFKNLFLMFVASDAPDGYVSQELGDTIVNLNVLSVGKYVFTMNPIQELRLMPGTRYTINVYADIVDEPISTNIKMNGIKFYSVTAFEDWPVNGPEVEYINPLELQKIYIAAHGG